MEANERNIIIFVFAIVAVVLLLMEFQVLELASAQAEFNGEVIKRLREIGAIK